MASEGVWRMEYCFMHQCLSTEVWFIDICNQHSQLKNFMNFVNLILFKLEHKCWFEMQKLFSTVFGM